jgi:hypothetical protein
MTEAQQYRRIFELWEREAAFDIQRLWKVFLKRGYDPQRLVLAIEGCGLDHPGYGVERETLELMQRIAAGLEEPRAIHA